MSDKSKNRLMSQCTLTQITRAARKHARAHHRQNCSMDLTCYVPLAQRKVSAHCVRENQSSTLWRRERQQDLEQSRCSRIWESTAAKTPQIDEAMLELRIDASAGRGVAVQRGGGRTRHIATPTLRAQKLTQDGKVKNTKIRGASRPADLGTKHLDGGSSRRASVKCHCYVRDGRSGIALRPEVQEIVRQHSEVFTLWNLNGNDNGSSDSWWNCADKRHPIDRQHES